MPEWNEQSGVASVDNFAGVPDWLKKLVGGAKGPAPTPAVTPPVTLGGQTPQVKSAEMSTTPIKPPPVSYASQAAQLQGQEPTRSQFPAQQQPVWKKLLGGVLSTAAGIRDPNVAGATAQQFFGAPKRQAEDEYNQAHQEWVGKMAQIANQANLAGKDAEIAQKSAQTAAIPGKDEVALAKIGMKRDESGAIVPDENSAIYQGQQKKLQDADTVTEQRKNLIDAQTELEKARTVTERLKGDPNSPAYQLALKKLAVEQQRTQQAAEAMGLHQAQFENKLQEQELVKPSGQSQSRGSAAQAVLDLIPDLEKNVRANAKEMGPLMGRLNRGEVAIGNVPPNVAQLYSAMKSFYALQPAVHGFRNAEFVKDFESALGTLERDPEAFIAGMKGLKPTLESVAKEGKTFHKRIVEGQKPPAGGAQPQGKPGDPLGIL